MVLVNFSLAIAGMGGEPEWKLALVHAMSGRAAATFVVLAGIGVALGSRRARSSADPDVRFAARGKLLRRAAFLWVVGLAFAPIWPPDILHYYGVYLGVAAALLFRPSGELFAWAAVTTLASLPLILLLDYETGWNFETLEYLDFWTPGGFLRNLLFNGFHPVVPWVAFLLLGMGLGRLDWSSPDLRRRLLIGAAAVAVVAEGLSAVLVPLADRWDPSGDLAALVGREPMPALPLYMLQGSSEALCAIVLSVSIARSFPPSRLVRAVIAVGRMALTAYIAHVVVGILPIVASGWASPGDLVAPFTATVAFAAVFLVFAPAWLSRRERGPVEAWMRRLAG